MADGSLTLDVSALKTIHVDPRHQRLRVGAGVTWGELDEETQRHGLAVTGASFFTTSVAGVTLVGGVGWLGRKLGLSCDNLLAGAWRGRAVQVAAELGIADLLAGGARSVTDLARSTGTDAGSLRRLLRALPRLGVFAELDVEHFTNNDVSTYLRADVPGSLSAIGRLLGAEWQQRAWGDLAYSVQTGLCRGPCSRPPAVAVLRRRRSARRRAV